MKTTDCVASNCKYLKHKGRESYRCTHPNIPPKKSHKKVEGKQIGSLKECPKGEDDSSIIGLFAKRF